jgi:hypothetical protein
MSAPKAVSLWASFVHAMIYNEENINVFNLKSFTQPGTVEVEVCACA